MYYIYKVEIEGGVFTCLHVQGGNIISAHWQGGLKLNRYLELRLTEWYFASFLMFY